jgi:hypothetical protein
VRESWRRWEFRPEGPFLPAQAVRPGGEAPPQRAPALKGPFAAPVATRNRPFRAEGISHASGPQAARPGLAETALQADIPTAARRRRGGVW